MSMNIHEYVHKLSKGNPGAINVMMLLVQYEGGDILDLYKKLEEQKISGSKIWLLWKDVCKRDPIRFVYAVNHPDCDDRKNFDTLVKKFVTKEICQGCTGDSSTLEEKFEKW